MPTPNKIDRAYARYVTLLRLIEAEKARSKSNPTANRYLHLGIIEVGDKPADAQKKIDERLDEIHDLIEHLAILDIAACFEFLFRQKISNAIGEARKAIDQQRSKKGKTLGTPALVKDTTEMRGLALIKSVLSSGLSVEVQDLMEKIRENRNNFAHGTDLSGANSKRRKRKRLLTRCIALVLTLA